MEKRWGEGGTPERSGGVGGIVRVSTESERTISLESPRTRSVRINPVLVQNRFEQSRVIQHWNDFLDSCITV